MCRISFWNICTSPNSKVNLFVVILESTKLNEFREIIMFCQLKSFTYILADHSSKRNTYFFIDLKKLNSKKKKLLQESSLWDNNSAYLCEEYKHNHNAPSFLFPSSPPESLSHNFTISLTTPLTHQSILFLVEKNSGILTLPTNAKLCYNSWYVTDHNCLIWRRYCQTHV